MLLKEFDFDVPSNKIALHPVSPRHNAKLLVFNNNKFYDKKVLDLADILLPNDLLIFNNSKVIPGRCYLLQEARQIEITLHKNEDDIWQAFAKPARKLKIGINSQLKNSAIEAQIISKTIDGNIFIKFSVNNNLLMDYLNTHGEMPLPPYIKRDNKEINNLDDENYQTIYAKNYGSFAAPTAGLHFSEELFEKLKKQQINYCFVTLNVGAGTFLPVKTDNILDHKMHSEFGYVSVDNCKLINSTRQKGGRIIAVGTTSLRIIESCAKDEKTDEIIPFSGETDIFITPGYKFKFIDILFTNFHTPKSTLFMLVSSFSGLNNMHKLYEHALDNDYRFFSYGDACLLSNNHKINI